ncbi:unnamed protein product, partial [Sphacelaria rigidula]
ESELSTRRNSTKINDISHTRTVCPTKCRRRRSEFPTNACRHDDTGFDNLITVDADFRGAVIAVWLAWGVRIDAVRARKLREERRLSKECQQKIAQV